MTFSRSYPPKRASSMSKSFGASVAMVTSSLARRTVSAWSRTSPWIRGGVTSSTRSRSASTLPNWSISLTAVLCPMPGTPGMLSDVSPVSAFTSRCWSGSSPPYRSRTASSS